MFGGIVGDKTGPWAGFDSNSRRGFGKNSFSEKKPKKGKIGETEPKTQEVGSGGGEGPMSQNRRQCTELERRISKRELGETINHHRKAVGPTGGAVKKSTISRLTEVKKKEGKRSNT